MFSSSIPTVWHGSFPDTFFPLISSVKDQPVSAWRQKQSTLRQGES